jgi:hypothetical protein
MLTGLGALNALAVVERQGAALQARFSQRRDVAADMQRFREVAPAIPDVESLLKDRRTLTVVLGAFQLETEIDKRGILRKVLTEDPNAEGALVKRLTDSRWKQLAQTLANRIGPPLGNAVVVDRIVDSALTNRYEIAMGEANPGLREALYFRRVAGGASTIEQVMGDRALLTVARGAVGLPREFGMLPYEQQRALLARRLEVSDLANPKAVARLAQRYVAQLAPAETSNLLAALFDGSGSANGIAALAGQFRRSV